MKRQNSPENLEKVQDLKLGGDPAAAGEAGWNARNRKEKMDYFMIILPLKLALVIYIAYILFH